MDEPLCLHHWVIDKPAGPTSSGVCRMCGEQRQFPNYIEGSAWGHEASLEQLAVNAGVSSDVEALGATDSSLDEDG